MRKKLLIVLIVVQAVFALGQNKLDAAGKKQGYWVKTDPKTNKKVYEGAFKDDKPQGVFKYYYPDTDSLRTTMNFKNDGKIAYATMYHLNGKLQAKGKYIGEQKDSVWNYYDETAKILSYETYKEGKKNGKSVVYFWSGNISEEKNYKLGLLDGPFKQYYDDKKIKGEGAYNNDQFIGKCSFYYPNGVAVATGVYEKGGIKKGVWLYKTIENKVESREVWVNGKQLKEKEAQEFIKKNKIEDTTEKTGGTTKQNQVKKNNSPGTTKSKSKDQNDEQ